MVPNQSWASSDDATTSNAHAPTAAAHFAGFLGVPGQIGGSWASHRFPDSLSQHLWAEQAQQATDLAEVHESLGNPGGPSLQLRLGGSRRVKD